MSTIIIASRGFVACCCPPQVAIAQFSDDARTEFQLNSHNNKEELLEAIQKIRYKGGNTKTGLWHYTNSMNHWLNFHTVTHFFSLFPAYLAGEYLHCKVAVRERVRQIGGLAQCKVVRTCYGK